MQLKKKMKTLQSTAKLRISGTKGFRADSYTKSICGDKD